MAKTNQDPEEFARHSNTMRGMTDWQRWAISIVAIVVLIAAIAYVWG